MKKILLSLTLLFSTIMMFGQGAKNIKINEVLTNNTASMQDEFGQHLPWVELANVSFSTYNIRGMFITTNRDVLDKTLSAPQRISMMSPIPNGEDRTSMSGRAHLLLFLNSNPAKGGLHLTTPVKSNQPIWIALYDGNGIDLIDSISVPLLEENKSFARTKTGWDIKPSEAVTPGIGNNIEINESKISKLKRDDPYGFGITVLSMGIVFFCLSLLYVFFSILGKFMIKKDKKNKKSSNPPGWVKKTRMPVSAKDSKIKLERTPQEGNNDDMYMAVIAMALKEYLDNIHDEESGIITIRPHHTRWNNEL